MQLADYRIIMVGKWHVESAREQWPDQRGFEYFYGIPNGGILTPLIVHWPKRIRKTNQINETPIHIMNIFPFCLELAQAKHPTTFKGKTISVLDG